MKKIMMIVFFGLMSFVAAGDDFTPSNIQQAILGIGGDKSAQFAQTLGVLTAINALQDYKIIAKAICLPFNPYDIAHADIVNSFLVAPFNNISTSSFPDTSDGGVAFVYAVFVAKYPCGTGQIQAASLGNKTPININSDIKKTAPSLLNHLYGVYFTIQAIQNYKIIPKSICVPANADTSFLKLFPTAGFPNSDVGGVAYFYAALLDKYPCPQTPHYAVGDTGPAGGIVFSVDSTGSHGIEAQLSDYNNGQVLSWQDAITAGNSYGDSWHLPTRLELDLLSSQQDIVGGFYKKAGGSDISSVLANLLGGMQSFYWSSTELDWAVSNAFIADLSLKYSAPNPKTALAKIRAVRVF